MRIDVYNGPNLNQIVNRSSEQYGITNEMIRQSIERTADKLSVECDLYQTNYEGEMIEWIHNADADGVVLNPAAWTHYSVAIRDAVSLVDFPIVEVHISNIHDRGEDIEWRDRSVIVPKCIGQVAGLGVTSYELGMRAVHSELESRDDHQ